MEISVLGPVTLRRDGDEVELGPRLQRLLAGLIVFSGTVVSVDRLVEVVWGRDAPARADSSLKTYVTRLRRVLDPADRGRIVFQRPGYRLVVADGELDSHAFESDVDAARLSLRTADPIGAEEHLRRALARWRGRPFGSLGDEEWFQAECVRLTELHVEARELIVEAMLAHRPASNALAEARALVADEPLRDRPRGLLMRALHAAGLQAEALRELQRFRSLLAEELGLDVSPELVELELRIARRDPALSGAVPVRGYEVLERIGEGAFAVVHRALQMGVEREVAVKIIRAELADRPEFIRRFEHEARLVARLEHPGIVPIHDFWREPGSAFLVMRLMRGGTVQQVLHREGPFSTRRLLALVEQVGSALSFAHSHEVIHRDVRPANLLFDDDQHVYLSDFGIARPTDDVHEPSLLSPAYSAPEVLRGEPAGPAADVLSMGITVFELCTGHLPFDSLGDRAALVRHQLDDPLPSVRSIRGDLPPGLDDVLAQATAKDPAARHQRMDDLVDDLRRTFGPRDRPVPVYGAPLRGVTRSNPYVGLRAFEETDAPAFHGRDRLIGELLDRLAACGTVVVIGPSGSGKSSLVRAGLIPSLRRGALPRSESWFVTTMIPGGDPFDRLEAALLRVAVNPPASLRAQLEEPNGISRAVSRVLPADEAVLLLVIDQLEELFDPRADPTVASRFLDLLAQALEAARSPVRLVATLRADRYDEPLQHPGFAEHVIRGVVAVPPMTPGEIESAIVSPARSAGVDVEPELVASLIASVSQRPAALPLLQFALTQLFDRRVSDLMLASTLEQLGGLTGVLASRVDELVAETDGQLERARRLFLRLVQVRGDDELRERVPVHDVVTDLHTADLVEALVAARILIADRDAQRRVPTIEIAHESLLRDWPRLRGWIEDDREDLRSIRQIDNGTTSWIDGGRHEADLARGPRLASAQDLLVRRPELLSDDERAWVAASIAAASAVEEEQQLQARLTHRQNQRLRRALSGVGVLLVLALVAGALAAVERSRAMAGQAAADEARARADIERLVAVSAAELEVDPARAMLLAVTANHLVDDLTTRGAVLRSLLHEPRLHGVVSPVIEEDSVVRFVHGGTVAAAWSVDPGLGRLQLFDAGTGRGLLAEPHHDVDGIHSIALSGDATTVAVVHATGEASILRRIGDQMQTALVLDGDEIWEAALDRTGSRLALGAWTEVRVIDIESGAELLTYELDDGLTIAPLTMPDAVRLSADGRRLAVSFDNLAQGDGTVGGVDVVDVATGSLEWRYTHDRTLGDPLTIELSPDGRHAVIVANEIGGPSQVRYLDIAGQRIVPLPDHEATFVAATVDDDGQITTASSSGVIRFLGPDGETRAPSIRLALDLDAVARSADGRVVASLRGGGTVVVHETDILVADARLTHEGPIRVATSGLITGLEAGGERLLAWHAGGRRPGSDHATIDLSRAHPGGAWFWRESSNSRWVLTAGPTASGNGLGVSDLEHGTTHVVDLDEIYQKVFSQPFHPAAPLAPRVGDDGRVFLRASLRTGEAAAMWIDPADGSILVGPTSVDSFHGPVLLLEDGRVAAGSPGAPTQVLSADLQEIELIAGGALFAVPLARDPRTGLVLVGGTGGLIALVDPDLGTHRELQRVRGQVTDGAFSPDGSAIAVQAVGSGVHLLDVATGLVIGAPLGTDGSGLGSGMAWSDDGTDVLFVHRGAVTRMSAEPSAWVEIACRTAGRDLSVAEWQRYVSTERPHVPVCGR